MDIGREGGGGTHSESSVDIYTLPCGRQGASGKLPYSTELSCIPDSRGVMAARVGWGGRSSKEGGGIQLASVTSVCI